MTNDQTVVTSTHGHTDMLIDTRASLHLLTERIDRIEQLSKKKKSVNERLMTKSREFASRMMS